MDQTQHTQLASFIREIEQSSHARKAFIDNPLRTLNQALSLDIDEKNTDLGLGNDLLISTLQNRKALDDIANVTTRYQTGEININEARQRTASILLEASPEELRARIAERWAQRNPEIGELDPEHAIANLIVHVDIAVFATEIAIIHSEIIGRRRWLLEDMDEVQRIASILAGGH